MWTQDWGQLVRKALTFLHLLITSKNTQEEAQVGEESKEFLKSMWPSFCCLLVENVCLTAVPKFIILFFPLNNSLNCATENSFSWCLLVYVPGGKLSVAMFMWQIEIFYRNMYWLRWHFHFRYIPFIYVKVKNIMILSKQSFGAFKKTLIWNIYRGFSYMKYLEIRTLKSCLKSCLKSFAVVSFVCWFWVCILCWFFFLEWNLGLEM